MIIDDIGMDETDKLFGITEDSSESSSSIELKDTVRISKVNLKHYKHIKDLKYTKDDLEELDPKEAKALKGLCKDGRIIQIDGDKGLVDFWSSTPTRVVVSLDHLQFVSKYIDVAAKEEVEIVEEVEKDTEEVIPEAKAVKFNKGKSRVDLVRPEFLLEMGKGLGFGAEKYSDYNYMEGKGLSYSDLIGSLKRHISEFEMNNSHDDESNIHHLAAVGINAMMLYMYEVYGTGKDNRLKVEK